MNNPKQYLILLFIVIGCSPYFNHTPTNECHKYVGVYAMIENIDSINTPLKVKFSLFGVENDTVIPYTITSIAVIKGESIYKKDSLVFNIELDKPIYTYQFPEIPDSSTIIEPGKKDLPIANSIDRNSDYYFLFGTPNSCYQGEWYYNGKFGNSEYRWLFDSLGLFNSPIRANFDNWGKKDLIEIYLIERRHISEVSFKLQSENGEDIPFEIVIKRNPTRTIGLEIPYNLDKFMDIDLLVSNTIIDSTFEHQNYSKYPLKTGSLSTVGMGGKWNFLEE